MRLNGAQPCNDEWFGRCGYDTLQVSMWCQAFDGVKVYLNVLNSDRGIISPKTSYGSGECPVQYYEFAAKPGSVIKFVVSGGIYRLGGLRCAIRAQSKIATQWYYTDTGGAFINKETYTSNKAYTATGLSKVVLTESTQPGVFVRSKLLAAAKNVGSIPAAADKEEYGKAAMIWVQTPATYQVFTAFEVKLL